MTPQRSLVRKVFGVLFPRVRGWWSNLKTIPLLLQLSVFAVALIQCAAPFMRMPGRSWFSLTSWKAAIPDAVALTVCLLYLRYEEKFRKLFNKRTAAHGWKVRMANLASVLDCLRFSDLRKQSDVEAFRERTLACVASGIAEILNLPPESLCANLLTLSNFDGQPIRMIVEARSDRLRERRSYVVNNTFLPWRAICDGRMVIEHTYAPSEEIGTRPYRSIVALPIISSDRRVGSLSIDCTTEYAFYGHEERILYQVRPYLSLLALTYGDASHYYESSVTTHA
jgi:GAF domain-containing protein